MRYFESVVTLQHDPARCRGCGMCTRVCPHGVFTMVKRRAAVADRGACMECGACAKNCERGAIRVRTGVGCAAAVLSGKGARSEPACACSQASAVSA